MLCVVAAPAFAAVVEVESCRIYSSIPGIPAPYLPAFRKIISNITLK